MLNRITHPAAVMLVTCGLLACGSGEDRPEARAPERPQPQRLTPAERSAARAGHDAIRAYCRRLGLHLAGRRPPPGAATQTRAIEGARAIARVARRKPEARYSAFQTARQLAGDTAEDLEGTNCSGRLVRELARGL